MPSIKELLGKNVVTDVISGFFVEHLKKKNVEVQPKRTPVCAEMIAVYEWLETHKCKAPFFCLMLQEGLDTSFLLNPEGEPAVFNDWEIVDKERDRMKDPNVWILEVEGIPN